MTKPRPVPSPRICAHCEAVWTPDSPTAAQGGFDYHVVACDRMTWTGFSSCSAACRRELGVVERYPAIQPSEKP